MVSNRGLSRTYYQLAVEGGAPLEISQRCGVSVQAVTQWLSRNRAEVEAGRQVYLQTLIDSLVLDRLTRCRQEDEGLHITQDTTGAAVPMPPHIQTLSADSKR